MQAGPSPVRTPVGMDIPCTVADQMIDVTVRIPDDILAPRFLSMHRAQCPSPAANRQGGSVSSPTRFVWESRGSPMSMTLGGQGQCYYPAKGATCRGACFGPETSTWT